jgi:hypothetical protein
MGRVQRTLGQIPTLQNLTRWIELLAQALAGNVSYGSSMSNTDQDLNLLIWKATGITPGVANTDFTINHSLGFVPNTIVGQDTNNGGLLYRGSVAWTKTTVTLRCTTATAAYKVILA